jgi:hypothetical protein
VLDGRECDVVAIKRIYVQFMLDQHQLNEIHLIAVSARSTPPRRKLDAGATGHQTVATRMSIQQALVTASGRHLDLLIGYHVGYSLPLISVNSHGATILLAVFRELRNCKLHSGPRCPIVPFDSARPRRTTSSPRAESLCCSSTARLPRRRLSLSPAASHSAIAMLQTGWTALWISAQVCSLMTNQGSLPLA